MYVSQNYCFVFVYQGPNRLLIQQNANPINVEQVNLRIVPTDAAASPHKGDFTGKFAFHSNIVLYFLPISTKVKLS